MDDAWLEYIIRKADENQSIIREADKDQRVGALLSILDEADIVVVIWREEPTARRRPSRRDRSTTHAEIH